MKTTELRLTPKQKLLVLLYLSGNVPAARLMTALKECEEMSVLLLEGPKDA